MMTSLPKHKLDDSSKVSIGHTQQAMKLEDGLTNMACGTAEANQPLRQCSLDSSEKNQVVETERSRSRSGILRSSRCLNKRDIQEPIREFTVQQSGSLCQEILDGEGDVVAWTVDVSLAYRICELLNR